MLVVSNRVKGWAYAFGWLHVLFDYAAHALVLGTHVGAKTKELD
jgi:hypothetical protein